MDSLNQKICDVFAGLVVRKDLVKTVKGNAIVPSYVLEYLLGQYCATDDETGIESGIETVKAILAQHYVHRNESGLIRSRIKQKGRYKVIDKISASLNDKRDVYEAAFSNLGIKQVLIDTDTIKKHEKLLVAGVWCIAEMEYEPTEDKNVSPWLLSSLKPIQMSDFDFDSFLAARKQFTQDEWIDLLMQSIGFNPEHFSRRSKLLQLVRLIPFCERNYNLIELGPKGTGKSHIYSEFSPHGMLISGGEVTAAKLFVNNASGKIGLVGYWDTVTFDEFAGKQKKVDKALVDIMKNYMANKSFSRGVETLGADASMVFVGNTDHSVPYMLKHSDLFDPLPDKFHDSAFLDRLHFYIPGWEVDIIRGEMFSTGFGFVVDYLAEALKHLRKEDFSNGYKQYFSLSDAISTRDRDAIHKTFSGLMKILFPHGVASEQENDEILSLAIEGRRRVKDQLMRIDNTYTTVDFGFVDKNRQEKKVTTLEALEYPSYFNQKLTETEIEIDECDTVDIKNSKRATNKREQEKVSPEPQAREQHITFKENQKGVNFDRLFGPYLSGAKHIVITDPYILAFHQIVNLMEFMNTVVRFKAEEDEIVISLVTTENDEKGDKQRIYFEQIQQAVFPVGIKFAWSFDNTGAQHARHVETDTGWKILLDRGLDIFQYRDLNNPFLLGHQLQKYRFCKQFEITFIRIESC